MAELLAQSINGVIINHDLIKSFFLEKDISFNESSKLTYGLDWVLAEDMIKQKRNIVMDSICNYNEVLEQGTALARRYGYDYRYVECRVKDIDLLDRRLRDRVPMRCQLTGVTRPPPDVSGAHQTEDYHALYKKWMESPCRPADNSIVVDSSGSMEESLDYVLKQIILPTGMQTINHANLKSHSREEGFAGSFVPSIAIDPYASPRHPAILSGASVFPPNYWVVPVIDEREFAGKIDGSAPLTIFIQHRHLAERQLSIDEVHRRILSRREWSQGDMVLDKLVVHTKFAETGLVLSPLGQGYSQFTNESLYLDKSGSSASVALVLGRNGQAEFHKTCPHNGIDGNGRPWLERQLRFLESSVAVRETDIFVKPLRHRVAEDTISIAFPYVPSHSLAEIALAGTDFKSLLAILGDLLGEMAACVWPKSATQGPDDYIKQVHFSRMRRRVAIARAAMPELDDVAGYEWITLNGRRLLGFDSVLEALSRHPTINKIAPRTLGEIHGDLNFHNVLCSLDPNAHKPIVLIDPRGVPLLNDFARLEAFEPGDYSYDISKLKFSLSGFLEVRQGLYNLQGEGKSFELLLKDHPGSNTMRSTDHGLLENLSSVEKFSKWVDAIEPSGFHSLELRVLLGEAAHFVADSACALGRGKRAEVLPLFLIGLEKLNNILQQIEGKGSPSADRVDRFIGFEAAVESPSYGAAKIQSALLGSSDAGWTWDLLEVLIKSESTYATHRLLSELVGECLPEGTEVHVSTHAVEQVQFPCVLIHPFFGVRGQTGAVLSSIQKTNAFLKNGGVPQGTVDRLRIVTITSTGASTRSQYVSRQNDKLLSPGPWGVTPLRLILLEVNQLTFPCAGRWTVENDSFFVLSRALRAKGDCLCLLTSKRRTTGSSSSWRVCIDSTSESDGRTFATGFREIGPHEKRTTLLRPTSAIFIPNDLGQALAQLEEDYATRSSLLLTDLVLARFMQRDEWIELCHSRGFGVNSDLAWSNAERMASLFPQVELAYGGDEMVFQHFGSNSEYIRLVEGVGDSPLLTSLAYLPSATKWLRRYLRKRAASKPLVDAPR